MADDNKKPSMKEKLGPISETIKAVADFFKVSESAVRAFLGLATAILALLSIMIFVFRYCTATPDPIKPPQENEDIKSLHEYLACVDQGLNEMENNAKADSTRINVQNLRLYKQTAIDLAANQMYPDDTEKLNSKDLGKLKDYRKELEQKLETQAQKFSIQLPDCK